MDGVNVFTLWYIGLFLHNMATDYECTVYDFAMFVSSVQFHMLCNNMTFTQKLAFTMRM